MPTLVDAFNPEDRVQVTFSEFYNLVKQAAQAELLMNGIKQRVDHNSMYAMMTGEMHPNPEM